MDLTTGTRKTGLKTLAPLPKKVEIKKVERKVEPKVEPKVERKVEPKTGSREREFQKGFQTEPQKRSYAVATGPGPGPKEKPSVEHVAPKSMERPKAVSPKLISEETFMGLYNGLRNWFNQETTIETGFIVPKSRAHPCDFGLRCRHLIERSDHKFAHPESEWVLSFIGSTLLSLNKPARDSGAVSRAFAARDKTTHLFPQSLQWTLRARTPDNPNYVALYHEIVQYLSAFHNRELELPHYDRDVRRSNYPMCYEQLAGLKCTHDAHTISATLLTAIFSKLYQFERIPKKEHLKSTRSTGSEKSTVHEPHQNQFELLGQDHDNDTEKEPVATGSTQAPRRDEDESDDICFG